jgi:hypothetical protein
LVGPKLLQFLVPGHQILGLSADCRGKDLVVFRVGSRARNARCEGLSYRFFLQQKLGRMDLLRSELPAAVGICKRLE